MSNPYLIRREAERLISEDRVPLDVLEKLIAEYGGGPVTKQASVHRRSNFNLLVEHYGIEDWSLDNPVDAPIGRYAGVNGVGEFEYPHIFTLEHLEYACDQLGFGVLEGLTPDGIYDLDTGQKLDVDVARPLVTISTNPETTYNPLEDK